MAHKPMTGHCLSGPGRFRQKKILVILKNREAIIPFGKVKVNLKKSYN
jgi:hypothetical protein